MSEKKHIDWEVAHTLPGLFRERVKRSGNRTAFIHYDRKTQSWRETSWNEAIREVARWQEALRREGLQRGDHVGLMLRNNREWVWLDMAAMGLGMIVVPLYADDRGGNVAYICDDAQVKFLLVGGPEQWDKLAPVADQLRSNVQRVVTVEPLPGHGHGDWIVEAEAWLPQSAGEMEIIDADPNDLATIVYTSGTTGHPKGVMLSHKNILTNVDAALQAIQGVNEDDLFLSFLPLSHMLERTAGYYTPMMAGSRIAYSRSIAELSDDLLTQKPTLLISVPRIYERVHAAVEAQLTTKSAFANKLFRLAIDTGWERFEMSMGRANWSPKQLLWPLLKKLVADKILGKLGGRMRGAMSGGAPLRPEVARMFIGLGLPILQGYGLTETSPVIAANRFDDNIVESVGQAVPGVEVKVSEDGELLTRGPHVMLGFWNRPEATREILEENGWFHTGDLARIDEAGHIFITGRVKDILVLANGEKVSPADMEMAIASDPLFDHVMVLGEGRAFLSAICILNPENWQKAAAELGLDPLAEQSLTDERVKALAVSRIANKIELFPGYAQIRKIHLDLEPLSIENGMLTPTLKIKRPIVMKHYAQEIDRIYAGH